MNPAAPTLHTKQIFEEEEAIWLLCLKGLLDITDKEQSWRAVTC